MYGGLNSGEKMPPRVTLLLIIPIIATSVVLLVVGGSAAWYVHELNQEVSHLLADNLDSAVACEQLVSSIRDARTELERFVDTGDRSHLETAVAARTRTSQSLDLAVSRATREVRDMLGQTQQSHDQFFEQFMIVVTTGSDDALRAEVRAMSRRLDTELLAPAQKILDYNRRALFQHSDRSRDVADRVGLGLLALGACGAVAGLLSGFGVARHLTRQLDQREREALRAEQLAAVGQLAAGLAHELRNPLTSMKILLQTEAERGDEASLTGRDFRVLQEEVERLEQLVNSFLDFARPPSLEKSSFNMRELVDQTIHLVSGPAARHDVAIEYKPENGKPQIDADPVQIRQVLLNLLLNAIDAMPEGGTVQVKTESQHREDKQWLAIQVIDNGPGISEEVRDRMFEPFVSTKETGTGLGLAICRRIVDAHGGSIDVGNGSHGGAVFTIRLPVRLPPRERLENEDGQLESETERK